MYQSKEADQVSWYAPRLERSLELVARAAPDPGAPVIDVGGGASSLVDDLLALGHVPAVLDLSEAALTVAKRRLAERASEVCWIAGDVTEVELAESAYDVWHDRAVFHFITDAAARALHGADHAQVERFVRYLARPPIAQGRLERLEDGRIRYRFKRAFEDGTTAVEFEPFDLREDSPYERAF